MFCKQRRWEGQRVFRCRMLEQRGESGCEGDKEDGNYSFAAQKAGGIEGQQG